MTKSKIQNPNQSSKSKYLIFNVLSFKYSFVIWILSFVICLLAFISVIEAGYDEDFKQASNLDYYYGLTNLQSAKLDINLASVIHQENLHIIQSLRNIEERLSKLEASIQRIEQEVIGK